MDPASNQHRLHAAYEYRLESTSDDGRRWKWMGSTSNDGRKRMDATTYEQRLGKSSTNDEQPYEPNGPNEPNGTNEPQPHEQQRMEQQRMVTLIPCIINKPTPQLLNITIHDYFYPQTYPHVLPQAT